MENKKPTQQSKRKSDYGLPDMRAYYIRRYGELPKGIGVKEFNDIQKEFWERIFNEVIYKGYQFRMPGGLGTLTLTSRKPTVTIDSEYNVVRTNAPIDYKATTALWERDPEAKERKIRLYHTNVATDGNIYSIKLLQDRRFRGHFISVYNLKPSRGNARGLAEYIRNNGSPL